MRKFLPVLFFVLACCGVRAADSARIFFPDLLPANTIACLVPPDAASLENEYAASIFRRLSELPEMGPFLQSFEESRSRFAADISRTAKVPPQVARDLVDARLGFAVLNVGFSSGGDPTPEFAVVLSLRHAADRQTVYSAVMELLNRPEVVRTVLESQGLDPNLPLRTLAQEETLAGYPPILRIGPNIRIAAFANLVMLYHGPGSEGIRKIFDAAANPDASLTRNPAFVAAYRGSDARPGGSFIYVNAPRALSLLDVLGLSGVGRAADALGLGSTQSIGMAGIYQGDGVRHTLFLSVPGGGGNGLMSALTPMPANAQIGVEAYGQQIPSQAEAFMAARVDMRALLREAPYLLDALGAAARPGGVAGMIANSRILGVPLADVVAPLGRDVVIRPHDDTQLLIFQNVDIPAFDAVIARMEENAGMRFNQLNVGGYPVRYFNRRAELSAPLAPAFCLIPRAPGSAQGILYMGSHPQAVASLIQETASAREPVSATPDYKRVEAGMGGGYSLFYYNGNRESYRRVYNFLLPVAALWSSSSRYPVDTGLLPTAASVTPALFGCSLGIKVRPDGMLVQSYGPVGFSGVLVSLIDKLVVSNPIVIGYAYSAVESWFGAMPGW